MDGTGPTKRARQKRNRIILACFDCRERKAGCDRRKPICSRCEDSRVCVYLDPPNNALVNGVSRKVSSLPADLKIKATKLYSQCLGDDHSCEEQGDDNHPEINPLILDVASYEEDSNMDEVLDVGFRFGKLQVTDRVGGQHRPAASLEMKALLQASARQPEWLEEQRMRPAPPGTFDRDLISPPESFLLPSAKYLAPKVGIISLRNDQCITDHLPPWSICDKILQHYWKAVHPVARILHRPSFERRWQVFTQDVRMNRPPVKSLTALVLAILFAGIVAMDPDTLPVVEGIDQALWLEKLHVGTELALESVQMVHTAKLETLHAFTAYLMVICRAEISRVHSALVAAAIRVAECIGLHCDGSERGYSSIETHVRRLIWYNLSFLDIRASESQGPRPIIRADEFTTKIPANVNDEDLGKPDHGASSDNGVWTEMTCTIIRFRCNEFIRSIWLLRKQLLAREISITSVLNKIEAFRLEWSLKFSPDNPHDALQQFTIDMLNLQTLRTYAMVLSPYYMHPAVQMPDRLLSILITNGIKTMEKVIDLETSERYKLWHWYSSTLQQHHYALLMSTDILMHPRRKDSARIWKGLEYVFEPPPLPPIARARWIVTRACLRMDVYLTQRRLRAPAEIHEHLAEGLSLAWERPTKETQTHSASHVEAQKNKEITTRRQSVVIKERPLPLSKGAQKGMTGSNPHRPSVKKTQSFGPTSRSSKAETDPISLGKAPSDLQGGQVLDVDWSVLGDYFPDDSYTGDLDVPYDVWSERLRSESSVRSEQSEPPDIQPPPTATMTGRRGSTHAVHPSTTNANAPYHDNEEARWQTTYHDHPQANIPKISSEARTYQLPRSTSYPSYPQGLSHTTGPQYPSDSPWSAVPVGMTPDMSTTAPIGSIEISSDTAWMPHYACPSVRQNIPIHQAFNFDYSNLQHPVHHVHPVHPANAVHAEHPVHPNYYSTSSDMYNLPQQYISQNNMSNGYLVDDDQVSHQHQHQNQHQQQHQH